MAITYRDKLETDFTTATASPVVNKPTGVVDGDLMLMFLVATGVVTVASGPIAGWTRIAAQDASTDATATLWYKVASSEGSSWTMTNIWGSSTRCDAVVVAYYNVDTTNPINKSGATSTSSTAVSGPSLTPDFDKSMFVQFIGTDPGTGTYGATPDTSPAAQERHDAKNSGGSNYEYIAIQEYLQSSKAALALDYTGLTSDDYAHFQVVLKEREATSSRYSYTKGGSSLSGNMASYLNGANPSYPASSDMDAYLKAQGILLGQMASYTKGTSTLSSNMAAYMNGSANVSSDMDAYLKGTADFSSNITSFLDGSANVESSQLSYLKGQAEYTSNQSAFTSGQSSLSGNMSAYLEGLSSGTDTSDSIHAYLAAPEPTSARYAFMIGVKNWMVPDGTSGSVGVWRDENDGISNIYNSIDEYPGPNYTNYIYCETLNDGDYYEATLTNPPGTPADEDIVILWSGRDSTGSGSMQATIQLRQGSSTVICSQQRILPTESTTFYLMPTAEERANITNWNDLRIRVIVALV